VERAHDAFLSACRRTARLDHSYNIAGRGISLSVAGHALDAALTPALAHVMADQAHADLTICAWDGASSGVAPPSPAWSPEDYYGNTAIRGFAEGRVRAAFDAWLGMLSLYDVERGLAVFWLRDASQVPITIAGTPLRIVFQWWADTHDRLLVHAAAVGTSQHAVLIAGPSGAGKSTTALVGLMSGLRYAGDDFVLVEPDPEPRVHALYNSAKIDDDTLAARFPDLGRAIHDRGREPYEKQLLFIHAHWPSQIVMSVPVRAILLPAMSGKAASRLTPAGSGDALRALVPGVLPFPGMRHPAVDRLGRFVRRVPSYRLELGESTPGIANALREACQV
jgi:hypothetical protein